MFKQRIEPFDVVFNRRPLIVPFLLNNIIVRNVSYDHVDASIIKLLDESRGIAMINDVRGNQNVVTKKAYLYHPETLLGNPMVAAGVGKFIDDLASSGLEQSLFATVR